MLAKEFNYFLENHAEFEQSYCGRYIVIKDEQFLGDFNSEVEAIIYAKKTLNIKMGTFLVQQCLPGIENYTHFLSATN